MALSIGVDFETSIDNILSGFVTSKSTLICAALVPVAVAAVTLYAMILGYSIAFGKISEPTKDSLSRFFKIIFICALALNQGEYQNYIVGFFSHICSDITTTLGLGSSIGGMIDGMFNPLIDIFKNYTANISMNIFSTLMLTAVLFIYLIVTVVLVVSALGYFILTKIAMAVLFAVGPIFIFLSLFPATQKFTESWISQVLQYAFLQLLLAVVISLVGDVTTGYANYLNAHLNAANPIDDILAIIVLLIGSVIVFFNINHIASSLSGGVGLNGMSASLAGGASKLFNRKPKGPSPNKITPSRPSVPALPPPSNGVFLYNRNSRKA